MHYKIRRYAERGWGYFRLYGARRFVWAVGFKVRQFLNAKSRRGYLFGATKSGHIEPDIVESALAHGHGHALGELMPSWFLANATVDRKPLRPVKDVIRKPLIVVIGDLGLPQCKKYRVIQKLEGFSTLNIEADYSHHEDMHRALALIQFSSVVIFYRVPLTPGIELLLSECRRLGVHVMYDIDDPIFSAEIYSKNINLAHLSDFERESLLASTIDYTAAMAKCDHFLTSTPRMVSEIQKLGFGDVTLWRNAIDSETEQAVSLAMARVKNITRHNSDTIKIVYASGSRAHEADFRTIETALLEILKAYPHVEFHVIGYLELPASFAGYSERIVQTDFSDYPGYISKLAECDIALVPLVIDDFNDCKSAIRFMEAALSGTACIATAVGDFKNIVTHGEDGWLATDASDWFIAMKTLIENRKMRMAMAKNASRNVRGKLGIATIAKSIPSASMEGAHAKA